MPKPKTKAIDPAVQDVLDRSTVTGNTLKLPEQLPRPDYVAVDKVLKGLGGKWDRRAGGHVFPFDPATLVTKAVNDGAYQDRAQTLQFFETPPDLAGDMACLAAIQPGDRVLEPSAGHGALVRAVLRAEPSHVQAVEIDQHNVDVLNATIGMARATGRVSVVQCDFLEYASVAAARFDVVVMNPPFSGGQDVAHIRAAWGMLKPGGRLVSVCGEGAFFRADRVAVEFRAWLDEIGAETRELPAGTFRASGTDARARLILAERGDDAGA